MTYSLFSHDHVFIYDYLPNTKALEHKLTQSILQSYLADQKWELSKSINGKPLIINSLIPLYISLTHSHNIMVMMLSSHDHIGVDIEMIKPRKYYNHISKRYFNHDMSLIDFYHHFTAKEAYNKAIDGKLRYSLAKPLAKDEDGFMIKDDKIWHISFLNPNHEWLLALCQSEKRPLIYYNFLSATKA